MLIPIRCFTCGNVLGDKWIPYITTIQEEKNKSIQEVNDNPGLNYIDINNPEKSIEGKLLDELGIHRYCCRRMMLSNVHLISYIN